MTAYSNLLSSTSLGIPGGCLIDISRALQNILLKFVYSWNPTSYMRISNWNFVCVHNAWPWAYIQSFSLKSSLYINMISGIVYFCNIILKSSQKVSEATPRALIKTSTMERKQKLTYINLLAPDVAICLLLNGTKPWPEPMLTYDWSGLIHSSEGNFIAHDEVIKWKHFLHYWPFVGGIHWSPVNSSHKGKWPFDVFCDLRLDKRFSKQSRRQVIWDAIVLIMMSL